MAGGQGGASTIELATRSAGKWTLANLPLPGTVASWSVSSISGISCHSTTFCVAVGSYSDINYVRHAFLATWSGKAWTLRLSPLPADASTASAGGGYLTKVACPAAGLCTAAGGYASKSSANLGLIVTLSHGKWIPAPVTSVLWLNAVSCPTAARCFAAGLSTGPPSYELILAGP